MNGFSLKQIIDLIDLMARMKMRAQANKLFLSYIWWLLEPLLFVSVFYVVFEYLLQRGGDGFFIFLIVGKIVFMWFSKGITMGSQSLIQNKGIIGQRAIPKWVFPLVNVQEATYKSLIGFIIMIVLLAVSGHSDPMLWWQLIPLLLLTYLFISGVSFILAILVAMAEDFSQVISLITMGLMFGSGVFWDVNSIPDPDTVSLIFLLNPLAALIDAYRTVLISNDFVNYLNLISVLVFSLFSWGCGLFFFKKWNNKITRFLFS